MRIIPTGHPKRVFAQFDEEADEKINEEVAPYYDSGVLADLPPDHPEVYEPHTYQLVGTRYHVAPEADPDPYGTGMITWMVIAGDDIVDQLYELKDVVAKYGPQSKPQQAPQEPVPSPEEEKKKLEEQIYDLRKTNDPRLKSLLSRWRELGGHPPGRLPRFMASTKVVVKVAGFKK